MHAVATPAWVADHVALISILALTLLAGLVVWVVQRTALRVVCVAVVAVLALFVYVNRGPLEGCARSCECRLVGQDVSMPACDPEESG